MVDQEQKQPIPGLLTRMFRPSSLMTVADADSQASKAAESASVEERRWHESGDGKRGDPSNVNYQDHSYLYEEAATEPAKNVTFRKKDDKGKLKNLGAKVKRALEHFVGTYLSGLFFSEADGQTVEELHTMQVAALHKYFNDPLATSVIDNWTSYTIGGGVKVHVDNPKVMQVINDFRNKNKMIKREKNLVKMFNIEGELFISYYISSKGEVSIRRVRPIEIQEVITADSDIETRESYLWEYTYTPTGSSQSRDVSKLIPDIHKYMKDVEAVKSPSKVIKPDNVPSRGRGTTKSKKASGPPYIQHVKSGIDVELRGRVPLQSVMRHMKFFEDWLMDRIRLNHERAKVVWIKQISGNRTQEETTRQRRAPRGGIMLVETDQVKYRIEAPKLASDDAKEDGLAILYNICAGTKLPIHILTQRTDEQVYASIRKADTPFAQFIRLQQEFFAESFEEMYRLVLKAAVEAGTLTRTTTIPTYSVKAIEAIKVMINEQIVNSTGHAEIAELVKKELDANVKNKRIETIDIPIFINFPDIISDNVKEQAETMQIQQDMGIVSKATLSGKAGYNWERELDRMATERVVSLEEKGEEMDVVNAHTPESTPSKTSVPKKKTKKKTKKAVKKSDGE